MFGSCRKDGQLGFGIDEEVCTDICLVDHVVEAASPLVVSHANFSDWLAPFPTWTMVGCSGCVARGTGATNKRADPPFTLGYVRGCELRPRDNER